MLTSIAEVAGTLLGFDDYVNMVLEDVTEFDYSGEPTRMKKILLNGNNICMVRGAHSRQRGMRKRGAGLTTSQLVPGGEGPEGAAS